MVDGKLPSRQNVRHKQVEMVKVSTCKPIVKSLKEEGGEP